MSAHRPRLVVVGNGMAGARFLEELLRLAPERYELAVFGAEAAGNYNRILLSPVLSGEKQAADIITHPPAWYARHGIALYADDPVIAIDRSARLVTTLGGRSEHYDHLVLATGSRPFLPPIQGLDLPGVQCFRTLADVGAMIEAARSHRRAVVIGGGLLGLEAAHGLIRRGMDVTLIHLCPVLMERQLDAHAASLLQRSLETRGLRLILPAQTQALLGDTRVRAVRLTDGRELPADLVVIAAGIVPETQLARAAGLACERGVIVDDVLLTSDPAISAIGECAQHRKQCYGLVAPLYQQARVCAARLAGDAGARYAGSVVSTKLKVTGIEVFSAGEFNGGEGCQTIVLRDPRRGIYKKLVLREQRLVGAVLYGDIRDGAWYARLMQSGENLQRMRSRLVFGQRYAEAKAEAA
ncbi:MAG: NAD(P)/FAD-dependent oxidoreductase [Nevskia sp.]|nr:NAD(P)/FAD-dependent oxidoreductase [Nevskia sp.]